jgi:hypothetical protein
VFENRALRRIFGPKRDEVIGGRRKLQNEEFFNLNSSPDMIRIIKSRSMRWVGHVARIGRIEMHIGFWCRSQKKGSNWEYLDVGGRIILKWILERERRGWYGLD